MPVGERLSGIGGNKAASRTERREKNESRRVRSRSPDRGQDMPQGLAVSIKSKSEIFNTTIFMLGGEARDKVPGKKRNLNGSKHQGPGESGVGKARAPRFGDI